MTYIARAEEPETLNHSDGDKHSWEVESRHWTSEGEVLYQLCSTCSCRRLQLRPFMLQSSLHVHELRSRLFRLRG